MYCFFYAIAHMPLANAMLLKLSAPLFIPLVALLWLGRGDFGADDWAEALALAEERDVGPTSAYLLSHPRVADQLASGLEELGYSHVMQDGRY